MFCLGSQPEIYNSGTLQSSSTTYFVLNLIGEGFYGKVAWCQNLQTKEEVAVKILKPDSAEDIKQEVGSLFVFISWTFYCMEETPHNMFSL